MDLAVKLNKELLLSVHLISLLSTDQVGYIILNYR